MEKITNEGNLNSGHRQPGTHQAAAQATSTHQPGTHQTATQATSTHQPGTHQAAAQATSTHQPGTHQTAAQTAAAHHSTAQLLPEDQSISIADQMMERKRWLENLVENKERSIASAPEGCLRVSDRKTHAQYYWRTDPKDTIGKYLPKKKIKTAKELAQKDYDIRVVKSAKKELVIIDKYISFLDKSGLSRLYEEYGEKRRILIEPVRFPDDEFIKQWEAIIYDPMGFEEDAAEYYSDNGIRVRSKSEIIIANMLERYRVPYRYEYPLQLKRTGIVRPDFYCLNVRTRREYVWEHFGMMDDEEYANKNISKINAYEETGFHAGYNLIITFETYQNPINSNIIRGIIKSYLL